jgi:hypothetical protein
MFKDKGLHDVLDSDGKIVAVIVPIDLWNEILEEHPRLKDSNMILSSINQNEK